MSVRGVRGQLGVVKTLLTDAGDLLCEVTEVLETRKGRGDKTRWALSSCLHQDIERALRDLDSLMRRAV